MQTGGDKMGERVRKIVQFRCKRCRYEWQKKFTRNVGDPTKGVKCSRCKKSDEVRIISIKEVPK